MSAFVSMSLCKLPKVHSSFTAITRGRGEERGSSRYAVKEGGKK